MRTAAADKAIHACQNPAARPVIYEDPQSRLPSKSSIQQPFVHSRDTPPPSTLLHSHTHLALTRPLRHAHVPAQEQSTPAGLGLRLDNIPHRKLKTEKNLGCIQLIMLAMSISIRLHKEHRRVGSFISILSFEMTCLFNRKSHNTVQQLIDENLDLTHGIHSLKR